MYHQLKAPWASGWIPRNPNQKRRAAMTQDFSRLARRIESEEGSVRQYVTARANNPTQPDGKKSSQRQSTLGYMIK